LQARADGFVDRIGYRDEAYAAIRERVGDTGDGSVELLFADRWEPRRGPAERVPRPHRPLVGYVQIRGAITSGKSRSTPLSHRTGSDTVTAALRAARENDRMRAVVIRVDSPGGSAVASETIWREVCRVREAGKPVVVSMGSVAASGGYYVSCAADVIVALAGTLTGSIGVIGGKVVVRELLERVGVGTAEIAASPHALMFSPRRRFDEQEQDRLAAMIDEIYADFVAKVAAGRRRPVAEIETLARGRVWTGADALASGLVDEIGGLRDAVRMARTRAELPEDAPLRPAVSVGPLARFGRPDNSEDPRAAATSPGLPELRALLEDGAVPLLRMPPIRLRG
jgi:protease-4